jgi:hypothetical protein
VLLLHGREWAVQAKPIEAPTPPACIPFQAGLAACRRKNGSRCRVPTDQGLVDVRSQQSDIFLARPALADSVNCAVFNDFVTTDNVVTGSRLIDCIPPPSISDQSYPADEARTSPPKAKGRG